MTKNIIFENEDQMKDMLAKWLNYNQFITRKGIHIKTFEIDIAALGPNILTENGVKPAKDKYLYAFETKIATTHELMKEVVEQAIIRLLVADFVYVVIPKFVEIWKNGITKEEIKPYFKILRIATGTYSKNIGIMTVEPNGTIKIIRTAHKSGLMIKELRELAVKEMNRGEGLMRLY